MLSNFDKVREFMHLAGQTQTTRDLENQKLCQFRLDLIREEVKELEDALYLKNRKEVADALGDILYVVYGAGIAFDIDLNKTFAIVHQSNMTKFCKTQQEAEQTVQYYVENMNRVYDSPVYTKKDDYYIVYNHSTGKILKSINYIPVNLNKI